MVANGDELDEAACAKLALSGAGGDAASCTALIERLWPFFTRFVRASRSMGTLARSDDHVHEVVARLVEKLGQPDGRGLRLYPPWREQNPEKAFADWIRIVTKNLIRDYVREQLGSRRASEDGISVKRLLNEFTGSAAFEERGVRPPLTAAQTARELLEFAAARLPSAQLEVLHAWLQGEEFDDIAVARGETAEVVRKLARSAVATLRREFAARGAI